MTAKHTSSLPELAFYERASRPCVFPENVRHLIMDRFAWTHAYRVMKCVMKCVMKFITCLLHQRDALLLALVVHPGSCHLPQELQTLRVRSRGHLVDLNAEGSDGTMFVTASSQRN